VFLYQCVGNMLLYVTWVGSTKYRLLKQLNADEFMII
jgi:hypothetical protein